MPVLLSLNRLKVWRRLVTEAIICLAAARILIALVPFRYWRRSLGNLSSENHPGENDRVPELALRIAQAVHRGAHYLPSATVCLPRAVAGHWMCGRRGFPTELVFGVSSGRRMDGRAALHAWVDYNGVTFIGQDDKHEYHRNLVLKMKRRS